MVNTQSCQASGNAPASQARTGRHAAPFLFRRPVTTAVITMARRRAAMKGSPSFFVAAAAAAKKPLSPW